MTDNEKEAALRALIIKIRAAHTTQEVSELAFRINSSLVGESAFKCVEAMMVLLALYGQEAGKGDPDIGDRFLDAICEIAKQRRVRP